METTPSAEQQLAARAELIGRLKRYRAHAQGLMRDPPLLRNYALVNLDETMMPMPKGNGFGLEAIPYDLAGVVWLTRQEAEDRAYGWNSLLSPEQRGAGCELRRRTRQYILNRIVALCNEGLEALRGDA